MGTKWALNWTKTDINLHCALATLAVFRKVYFAIELWIDTLDVKRRDQEFQHLSH